VTSIATTNAPRTSGTTATFSLDGRLLSSSGAFMSLLSERSLQEDLLAVPRALALRTACGYDTDGIGSLSVRRFHFRGIIYILHSRYVVSDASEQPVGVSLLVETEPAQMDCGSAAPARRSPTQCASARRRGGALRWNGEG
jgi:hypothetical protein